MYYIINITKDNDDIYRGETFVFPVLNKVDDIMSHKLTLNDKCAKNLSKKYDILFEVIESEKISEVIKECAKNIHKAHNRYFMNPVIGIFNDGEYDERLTMAFKDLEINNVEPLTKTCKI